MEHVFVCDKGGSYQTGPRITFDVPPVSGDKRPSESVDEARQRLAADFFSDPVNERFTSVEVTVFEFEDSSGWSEESSTEYDDDEDFDA